MFGVIAVTLPLAIELKQTNIKVNVASPGYTKMATNNCQGIATAEQGTQDMVRVVFDVVGPTGTCTGPGARFLGSRCRGITTGATD